MTTDLKEAFSTRELVTEDIDAVVDIEHMTHGDPMTKYQISKCLRRKNVTSKVAVLDDKVVGFMLIESSKNYFNLLNLVVHEEYRRRGVGKALLSLITSKLSKNKQATVSVVVRETNLQAQLYFKACGMRAVNVMRGHFEDTNEDGYRMEYRLRWPAAKKKATV